MKNENEQKELTMEEYANKRYREGLLTGVVWTLAALGVAVVIGAAKG